MSKDPRPYKNWGTAATLMEKDRRIALTAYVSVSGTFVCITLYAITKVVIFEWLAKLSVGVWGSIAIGGAIINVRDYLRERKAQKEEQ